MRYHMAMQQAVARALSPSPSCDEEEILNWDYALDVIPPPKRSGTLAPSEVVLCKVEIPAPNVEDE